MKEEIMEKMSLKNELSGNSYPGRGIIIGKSADGKHAITAYFIMGRSENSRNRVFVYFYYIFTKNKITVASEIFIC